MINYRNQNPSKNKYHIPYNLPSGAEHGDQIKGRTLKHWENRLADRVPKSMFSKRLQRDLKEIGLPADPPNPDLWEGEGLFVSGPAGSGKTVLAANLLLDIKKHLWLNFQDRTLQFVSVPSLFNDLKRSFDSKEDSQYDILDELNNTWLLVLDDLGVSGKPSDWLLETLYLIINHRYENLLPVIITSNLGLDELSSLYGDTRITSRIDRMCRAVRKTHWRKGED